MGQSIIIQKLNKTQINGTQKLHVLKNINLNIEQGEYIAITGPSGSGKSTLLSLIGGLDQADANSKITVNGFQIDNMNENELSSFRAKNLGFIFQDFQLLENMSALENVSLALDIQGKKDSINLGINSLSKVHLEKRMHHFPNQLSGGEKQRVAIARATVHNPSILLADEPTGNLDSHNGKVVMDLLMKARLNCTLILVTHNEELAKLANREIKLKDGIIENIINHKKIKVKPNPKTKIKK